MTRGWSPPPQQYYSGLVLTYCSVYEDNGKLGINGPQQTRGLAHWLVQEKNMFADDHSYDKSTDDSLDFVVNRKDVQRTSLAFARRWKRRRSVQLLSWRHLTVQSPLPQQQQLLLLVTSPLIGGIRGHFARRHPWRQYLHVAKVCCDEHDRPTMRWTQVSKLDRPCIIVLTK